MDDFNSETDSDYTSYWRDWVSGLLFPLLIIIISIIFFFSCFGRNASLADGEW